MRHVAAILCIFMLMAGSSSKAQTEQEIVNKYLKKTVQKHTKKLSWMSLQFSVDRINRSSSYNDFATLVSKQFSNASLSGLDKASSFGLDMGVFLNKKFAWTVGGEYWMKLGDHKTGSFNYDPPNGSQTTVTDLVSEIKVFGVTSGVNYYLYNPPSPQKKITDLSIYLESKVGFYWSSWDLWKEFENLNLSTSAPVPNNTTFKGSAPSLSFGAGIDYPLNFFDLAVSASASYLYLNFTNVAWYNSQDEEVVITYNGTADSRIDLDLSGFRGKFEIKRYFHW